MRKLAYKILVIKFQGRGNHMKYFDAARRIILEEM